VIEWVVRDFSLWGSSAMAAVKETKFGTIRLGDEDDARMSNTCIAHRKCAIAHSTMKNMTALT